jgi:hypothetical protein
METDPGTKHHPSLTRERGEIGPSLALRACEFRADHLFPMGQWCAVLRASSARPSPALLFSLADSLTGGNSWLGRAGRLCSALRAFRVVLVAAKEAPLTTKGGASRSAIQARRTLRWTASEFEGILVRRRAPGEPIRACAVGSEERTTMKRVFGIAMLALPLVAGVAHAWGGPFGPYKVDAGANVYFRVTENGSPYGGGYPCGATCGPWYNYWPLEAHFQKPALGFPFWPSSQVAVNKDAHPVAPPAGPPPMPPVKPVVYHPAYAAPSPYQATCPSFGYPSQAPSYWYGQ